MEHLTDDLDAVDRGIRPYEIADEGEWLAGLDDRYFSVIVKAGRVESTWPEGMAPWESTLLLCTEAIVDHTIEPSVGERKVRTPEEWAEALAASEREGTTFRVWIRLGLEDLVKEAGGRD